MSWDGLTLLDSFERDGEWWLSEALRENRVAGRVYFDPAGGVRLRTFRPFREEMELEPGVGLRPPLILGFWGHGTPLCLQCLFLAYALAPLLLTDRPALRLPFLTG